MGLNREGSEATLGLNPSPEICLSGGPVGTPSKRLRWCVWTRLSLLVLEPGLPRALAPTPPPSPTHGAQRRGHRWLSVRGSQPLSRVLPSVPTLAGQVGTAQHSGFPRSLRITPCPVRGASRVHPICLGSQRVCAWRAPRTVLGLPCGCARGHRQSALCGCPGTQGPFPLRGTACVLGGSHPPPSAWFTEARVHPSQASVRADLRQRLQPV